MAPKHGEYTLGVAPRAGHQRRGMPELGVTAGYFVPEPPDGLLPEPASGAFEPEPSAGALVLVPEPSAGATVDEEDDPVQPVKPTMRNRLALMIASANSFFIMC